MGKRISNLKANTLRVYREVDFRGKEVGSTFGTFYGAGIIGTGSPTRPRKYQWTFNGDIITEYEVDISGLACKGTAISDVIGLDGTAPAYLDKIDHAAMGVIYRAEMHCLEAPGQGTATITSDIDLTYDALATLHYDDAGDGAALAAGAAWTLGKTVVTEDTATGFADDNYIYLGEGSTEATTGVYNAGKFLIRLYGRVAFS